MMFLDRGAVLSVVMSGTGEQCFSGGVDGSIQCWNTPNPNIDPYDSYGNGAPRGGRVLTGGYRWLTSVSPGRPLGAAGGVVRTHRLGLGFGVQQRSPAPPVLLLGRDGAAVGRQHHLPRPCSIQRGQKYVGKVGAGLELSPPPCSCGFFLRAACVARAGGPFLGGPGLQRSRSPGHVLH